MADDIIRNQVQAFNGVGRKDNGSQGKALHVHIAGKAEGDLTFPAIAQQPDAAPRLVLAANPNRIYAEIVNEGDVDVRIGDSDQMTFALPFALLRAGEAWSDKYSTSAIYAVTGGAAAVLTVKEVVKSS